jgi:hypothetical protein
MKEKLLVIGLLLLCCLGVGLHIDVMRDHWFNLDRIGGGGFPYNRVTEWFFDLYGDRVRFRTPLFTILFFSGWLCFVSFLMSRRRLFTVPVPVIWRYCGLGFGFLFLIRGLVDTFAIRTYGGELKLMDGALNTSAGEWTAGYILAFSVGLFLWTVLRGVRKRRADFK